MTDAVAARRAAFDFEAVFRSDYHRVARVIGRVIRDPARAEDLAVETFWRLWRNPPAQGENSGGWLYRTAVRLALDELRRRARRARYEQVLTFFRASPRMPDELFSEREEQGRVRTALAAMPPRQASLLLLHGEGLSYHELAAVLSINPASVGTLMSRARAGFRREYVRRYGEQSRSRREPMGRGAAESPRRPGGVSVEHRARAGQAAGSGGCGARTE